jgi:DNA-binding protein Fis
MKAFSKWTIEEVEEQFNLVACQNSQRSTEWLTIRSSPSQVEVQGLDLLQKKLYHHLYDWNEQELIVYFIAPLLVMVNFEQENNQAFFQREISVTYNNEVLAGIVDIVVATGKHSPKNPFFLLHVDKKDKDSANDPLGQLLIAMFAAQQLNHDQQPVYGAYVMGRYWHFVVLDQLEYAVHAGFNASKKEIQNIFGVLKKTKAITVARTIIQAGDKLTISSEQLSCSTTMKNGFELTFDHEPTLDEIEEHYLKFLLQKYSGHRLRVAEALGIGERQVYRLLNKYRFSR